MLDPRNSGKIQVTDANTLAQLSKQDVIFRTDGYFYVYVTNQSETHVNFDNLIIRRWKPQVRVTYDYYPFGLTWENPKLPGTEEGLHDHTYQDKEYQFAEFADGRGLELHDFHARMYDATTGRWLVPDPAAQFANPYLAMGNNPVTGIDPDGKWVHIIIGAGIGGVANWIAHGATLDSEGLKAFGIGAVAGGVGAATLGVATAAMGGAALSAGITGGSALAGAVGSGGFIGGGLASAISATASNLILSEGNHQFLGDPRWSDSDYISSALFSFGMGGITNGYASMKNGNGFWTGKSATAIPSANQYQVGAPRQEKRVEMYTPTWKEIQADFHINPISGEFIGDEVLNPSVLMRGSTHSVPWAFSAAKTSTRFVSAAEGVVHDLKPTLDRIASGGKFPHRNDGSIFKNMEGLLPKQSAGYYKEFVHPTLGAKGPGAMRIVTGQGGEMWFTPDHYKTFIPIR
jgi:RHS repeat-associated protein